MDIEREMLEQELVETKAELKRQRAARRRYHHLLRKLEKTSRKAGSDILADMFHDIRRYGERGDR